MQDGIDFITALATHPDTGRRLARKLWGYFVSEVVEPDEATLNGAASAYLQNGTSIQSLVHFMLRSRQFQNPGNWHTRYSWPVEFVVRAVKEVGWASFNVDTMRDRLTAMGQVLFEPPDVNGWELGPGWFTTGGLLARMNFAASLAGNQRGNLVSALSGSTSSPESVLDFFLDRLTPAPFSQERAQRAARVSRSRRCVDRIYCAGSGESCRPCAADRWLRRSTSCLVSSRRVGSS